MGLSCRPRIRHGEGDVAILRAELAGVTPRIWRRLAISTRASLLELHAVIQGAFGQAPAAEHEFERDGVRYLDPDGADHPSHATDHTALSALGLSPGSRFTHAAATLNDPWRHVLTVEQVTPRLVGQRVPLCLEAFGAPPPDDCDGPTRYRELLAALDAPLDPRAAELREWLPADFDPRYANLNAINAQLARLPKHRPAA